MSVACTLVPMEYHPRTDKSGKAFLSVLDFALGSPRLDLVGWFYLGLMNDIVDERERV